MRRRTIGWGGCGTELVTPFDEKGRLDFAALERLVSWQIESGADFLVPAATTGESATLSGEERRAVVAAVVLAAAGRVPVLAGAGGNHTAKAVFWARDAEAAGASALLSVTPMYNRPTIEGLSRHYAAIAEATRLPIVISNVPGRTGTDLDEDDVARLAEIPGIAGMKEGSGNLARLARLMARLPDSFAVFSADELTALPVIALGGRGVISPAANVAPREVVEMVRAALAGDGAKARARLREILPVIEMTGWETNPGPVKCALSLMRRCGETLRLPLAPVTAETRRRIEKLLAERKELPRRKSAATR
ncbi:MAG TPA: 4-hydroxy-tetrahydrodipicolinate synthase [Thermoanaerobaculia bacterium]